MGRDLSARKRKHPVPCKKKKTGSLSGLEKWMGIPAKNFRE